ncbi:MAG: hypothetical protein K1W35_25690 [Lachnospiraceae bacterium]
MIDKVIELSNIEIYEHCMLDIRTGEKEYNMERKQISHFTGLYFKDEDTFFAFYPTTDGPTMYYEGKEYPLKKDLHISLSKTGKSRVFFIEEYNICIQYRTSPYIGFDVWSEEMDVDLFYQIEQSYKNDEYYKRFTI